jgi:phosphate transporter
LGLTRATSRYDSLKSAIYRLEKDAVSGSARRGNYSDLESAALLDSDGRSERDKLFASLLDEELAKVSDFYKEKEHQLLTEVDNVAQEIERVENDPSYEYGTVFEDDEDDDEDDDDEDEEEEDERVQSRRRPRTAHRTNKRYPSISRSQRANSIATAGSDLLGPDEPEQPAAGKDPTSSNGQPRQSIGNQKSPTDSRAARLRRFSFSDVSWAAPSTYLTDTRIALKLRLQGLFRDMSQLSQFASLNHTGFRKILKK